MKHTTTRHVIRQILALALLLAGGRIHAQPAPLLPFTYQNPIDFSYPYYDSTKERKVTELRDPAILREGDTFYLTFTVFPFTHSDSRKAEKPDDNSPPGIMLYSSPDLKSWKFEKWLVKCSELPDNCLPWRPHCRLHRAGREGLVFLSRRSWWPGPGAIVH